MIHSQGAHLLDLFIYRKSIQADAEPPQTGFELGTLKSMRKKNTSMPVSSECVNSVPFHQQKPTERQKFYISLSLSLSKTHVFFQRNTVFPPNKKIFTFASSLKIAMRTRLPSLWSSWLTVPSALDISIGSVGWIGLMDSSHNGPATKNHSAGW